MSMLISKQENVKEDTNILTYPFSLLDINMCMHIDVLNIYRYKGTIERECEFSNQYHKISLNNAFVLFNLLFLNLYACISIHSYLYL